MASQQAGQTSSRKRRQRRQWIQRGLIVAVVLVLAWVIFSFVTGNHTKRKQEEKDKVVELKQPPEPKEPPKKKKQPEKKIEKPEPKPDKPKPDKPKKQSKPDKADAPPPKGPPALNQKGEGAPDAFGMQGVEGGAGFVGGNGSGGGGGGGYYGTVVQNRLKRELGDSGVLNGKTVTVRLFLTLDDQGRVISVEFIEGSGSRRTDDRIKNVIQGMSIGQPPPNEQSKSIETTVSAR